MIGAVPGITLIFMNSAKQILNIIRDSGVSVLKRIMRLIQAAVAVDSVLTAAAQFFKIKL